MFRFPFVKKRTNNSGKPQLVIHIGVGKTGTSALQTFFEHNEKNLLKHGICYPKIGRAWTSHHRLSHIIPPSLKYEIPSIPSAVWAEKLAKQPYEKFLISTELMHTITQEQVQEYLAPVMQRFEVYIALYMRRQDETILSAYNQGIKALGRTLILPEFIERAALQFDYAKKIRHWASVVGDDHILPAIYDRACFTDGDLRKDFLKRILHIKDFSSFQFPEEKQVINERLTNDGMCIKRVLNHIPMPVGTMRDLEHALHEWGRHDPAPHDFWPLLSDEEQDALMQRFADSNREVALRYFHTDEALFSPRKMLQDVYTDTFPAERLSSFAAFLAERFPKTPPALLAYYAELPEEKRTEELRLVMDHITQSIEKKENLPLAAKSR